MAREHWTDGYREGSLMPNDHGLRQCRCGNFYTTSELLFIRETQDTYIPATIHVAPQALPQAIENARTREIELAARLDSWHEFNHAYRDLYRSHRKLEDAQGEKIHATARGWLLRLHRFFQKSQVQSVQRPFTVPPFEPTTEQLSNLRALIDLLLSKDEENYDPIVLAELHREMGLFDEANKYLRLEDTSSDRGVKRLLGRLIDEKITAPVRYRT